MVSGDEPELDAFVHDAHPVFEFDALVPVPDHVLVQQRDELVDRDALEASLVEELLLEPACFASMFVRQVRQCFSAVWADGFPRCRHRFPVM